MKQQIWRELRVSSLVSSKVLTLRLKSVFLLFHLFHQKNQLLSALRSVFRAAFKNLGIFVVLNRSSFLSCLKTFVRQKLLLEIFTFFKLV